VLEIRRCFPRRLIINLTPFVPKPHTPFQWAAMAPAADLRSRQDYVQRELGGSGVSVSADSPAWAEVQGVLARGDRRLAGVLASMRRVSLSAWRKALSACGLRPSEFLNQRGLDDQLPWNIVDTGINMAFLRREWLLSQAVKAGHSFPPGAYNCTACGVCEPRCQDPREGPTRPPYQGTLQ
jgi:hypothetical protein